MHDLSSISRSEYDIRFTVDEGTLCSEIPGQEQVVSTLQYIVDPLLEKGMSDALDDADAIHHLMQFRRGGG